MTNFPRRSLVAFPVALLAGCLFNGGSGPGPEPTPIEPGPIEPPPTVPPRITAYLTGVSTRLTAFDVAPDTGVFTQIGAPVEIGAQPDHFVVDPAGKFAYVISNVAGGSDIFSFRFDETGLPIATGEPHPAGNGGLNLALHPSGRFLYAVDMQDDLIHMFTVDDSGRLSSNGSVGTGPSPAHMSTHPGGTFAYVSHNNNGVGSIRVYAIDAAGILTEIVENRVDLPTTPPGNIVIDRSGGFAYVAIFSSEIWVYEVDSVTGALRLTGQHDVGANPNGFAVDPSGTFVYAAASQADSITALRSSGGALSFIGAYDTGARPSDVVVDAPGKFVYVVNNDSESVSVFAIDRLTGALEQKGQPFALPGGFSPDYIAVVERPR